MIVRFQVLRLLLLYASVACAFQLHARSSEGSEDEKLLRRVQAYLAERGSPYQIHPDHLGSNIRNRDISFSPGHGGLAQNIRQHRLQSSYVVEPEEREIDSIGKSLSRVESTRITEAATQQQQQGEVPIETMQKYPKEDKKQARAPLAHFAERSDPEIKPKSSDIYFIALVAGCSGAAVFGVVAAGLCWYKLQKNVKAAAESDYPSYGVTGPSKEPLSPPTGDRKLAQSAQMYHYQHQKQQMIAIEKAGSDRHVSTSDLDSEEENEEGDYTVYECPGLASTGEMEVKNPLFQDEATPASPHITVTAKEQEK